MTRTPWTIAYSESKISARDSVKHKLFGCDSQDSVGVLVDRNPTFGIGDLTAAVEITSTRDRT